MLGIALASILFVEILNCETVSEFRGILGGWTYLFFHALSQVFLHITICEFEKGKAFGLLTSNSLLPIVADTIGRTIPFFYLRIARLLHGPRNFF